MTSENQPSAPHEKPLTKEEILYWVEFVCWTTLALSPFLYWVNGPAVSTDQFVVRTALVVLAAIGAISVRAAKVMRNRKAKQGSRAK